MGIRFRKLEKKVEAEERRKHPNYTPEHIRYIGKATAGKVYREQQAHRPMPPMRRRHHCNLCGITH
jgi:hypothetical protein